MGRAGATMPDPVSISLHWECPWCGVVVSVPIETGSTEPLPCCPLCGGGVAHDWYLLTVKEGTEHGDS